VTEDTLQIARFDLPNATEREYAALHRFTSTLRRELMPDDPPTPLDVATRAWRNVSSLVTTATWLAWRGDGAEVVARAQLIYANTAENRNLAQFSIEVLPEMRRRGLARRLLAALAPVAREADRRVLIASTTMRAPGGAALMERLGAAHGLEGRTSQLAIADVNHGLIDDWRVRAKERASGFELGSWDGPYPEEDLDAAAALYQVMNTAPRGGLAIEDQRITPEHLRQMDKALFARGSKRWTLYAREKASGKLAGFTDVVWTPSSPEILNQINTGVFSECRGLGLARWLKAEMLDKVMRERPEVRFFRTANADSNAAMLKINDELGFKPYSSLTVWQADLEKVEAYLRSDNPAANPI
jgi:GNAT superfamily N-acetyltransferase